MPGRRVLPRILFPTWPDMQALADEWKAFIERCDAIAFGVGFETHDGDGGKTVTLAPGRTCVAAVVTTEIGAASGSTLGWGEAKLRLRTGSTLADGPIVTVYSNMSSAVAVNTRIHVHPDGADYMLGIVDCVP